MKVALRDIRFEDEEMIRTWRNSPEVASYMYKDHFISSEEHGRWVRDALKNRNLRYWIIVFEKEAVGLANLYNLDPTNRKAYWSFYLGSASVRGKGVGSVVEYLILCHVFDELGFHRLCCEVLASNLPVIEMHKSFGFVQEGYFRQHVIKGGRPQDAVLLAMVREDWERKRTKIEDRMKNRGYLD
jgi:UDP-4-amino-4,6-dideoxy-N-acetyl-beta-L-altrosamine N-acetyltransferase